MYFNLVNFNCIVLYLFFLSIGLIVVIGIHMTLQRLTLSTVRLSNYDEMQHQTDEISIDFDSVDNLTGFPHDIVPNIVHLIKFRQTNLTFVEMINIRSIFINHRPNWILIHCSFCKDVDEHGRLSLTGLYWEMLVEDGTRAHIRVLPIEEPVKIFGRNVSCVEHASDIARLKILMKYGGIYLDTDVYVVKSLRVFLHFEMTLGWDEGQYLGTQVLIAHKDARFLKLWMNSYRNYKQDLWYFNAGEYPTTSILYQSPHLVHRVKVVFGVHLLIPELFQSMWTDWITYYTIHLLINHRSYLDRKSTIKEFDHENILTYNFTYGVMARTIMMAASPNI